SAGSAAAHYLQMHHPHCKTAYVVGKLGLIEELELIGIQCFGKDDKGGLKDLHEQKFYDRGLEHISAVVVGHMDDEICYERLAKGSVYAQNRSRPFIATNLDQTSKVEHGENVA